jgi:hypothetical protein
LEELIVWLGHVPEMVTFVPATNAGVVVPVPPLRTGSAVPDKVIARVPEVVIGEPATLRKAGTVAATLVTDPEAPALLASSLTVPALFLKYSFSSRVLMLSASSPATKLVLTGTAAAVVL